MYFKFKLGDNVSLSKNFDFPLSNGIYPMKGMTGIITGYTSDEEYPYTVTLNVCLDPCEFKEEELTLLNKYNKVTRNPKNKPERKSI